MAYLDIRTAVMEHYTAWERSQPQPRRPGSSAPRDRQLGESPVRAAALRNATPCQAPNSLRRATTADDWPVANCAV